MAKWKRVTRIDGVLIDINMDRVAYIYPTTAPENQTKLFLILRKPTASARLWLRRLPRKFIKRWTNILHEPASAPRRKEAARPVSLAFANKAAIAAESALQ